MRISIFQKLLLIVLICEIIRPSELQIIENSINFDELTFGIQNVLVKILKDCKKDYDTILIFMDSVEMNFQWIQELQTEVSIISHQNLSTYIEEYSLNKKLDAYVIIIQSLSSVTDVYFYLSKIFKSVDGLMPVYVLTTEMCDDTFLNPKNYKVKFFELFFQKMNAFRVVTSYLICADGNDEIKLYTYNMFNDRAPQRWKRIEKIAEGRWTIYERNFIEDDICEEFDFDRTNYLDGFELIIASGAKVVNKKVIGRFRNYSIIYDEPKNFNREQIIHIDALVTALNVNCKIYFNTPQIDKKGKHSLSKHVESVQNNSSFDIYLTPLTVNSKVSFKTLKGSYPSPRSQYGIITHHKGYQTFPEKIRDFYGIWTMLFTVFIILAVSIVIWFSENKKIFFTVFEIIRLLISQNLHTRMNTFSLRIFFSMVFIYFLVIQSTFNGHLARFLTKPQLRQHADTLQDLQDLGYTKIYNNLDTKEYLAKTFEESKSVRDLSMTCAKYILYNDTSAACISDYLHLKKLFNLARGKLYLSKKSFSSFNTQYLIHQSSPLRDRIYSYFVLTEELGLSQFIRNKANHHTFFYHKKVIEARAQRNFRPIKIDDLKFFFIVFGIGLSGAMCSFCIEMCIYYCKRKTKNR